MEDSILEEGSLIINGGDQKEPLKPGLGIMDTGEGELFDSEEEVDGEGSYSESETDEVDIGTPN